jgi:hypothetical protein
MSHHGPREIWSERGAAMNSAHIVFDRLWKSSKRPNLARNRAYEWLCFHMGKTRDECHFSKLTPEECIKALQLCRGSDEYEVYQWIRRRDSAFSAGFSPRKN